jgi:hypothetical protein
MGFYSSWTSFAICHHYVLYVCCRKLRISWFSAKYKLLGDDIVIWDEHLALLYRDIMIKTLGVEISDSKTHISKILLSLRKDISHLKARSLLFLLRLF